MQGRAYGVVLEEPGGFIASLTSLPPSLHLRPPCLVPASPTSSSLPPRPPSRISHSVFFPSEHSRLPACHPLTHLNSSATPLLAAAALLDPSVAPPPRAAAARRNPMKCLSLKPSTTGLYHEQSMYPGYFCTTDREYAPWQLLYMRWRVCTLFALVQ